MPQRRLTSSQNSQANNDVPPPLEGLLSMNAEGIYRYLETLVGLVERQARAIEAQALGQPSSSKGSSFDDFKKLGSPYFSEVVDRALIAEKDNKEPQQYKEQRRKRSRSDSAHDNQAPKRVSLVIKSIELALVVGSIDI
ncbi:hypothetical protein CK203_051318 [Vitis vinifera]|uniref:Uncharacterized protein n=1 Tax=Vitis vinifera TaxID=29760 RepID=A0A438H3S9_VITVI|nr:hypothetical protein CK203_051318 [Vitis vinifera]